MRHQLFFRQMHYYVVSGCQVTGVMLKLYRLFIAPIDRAHYKELTATKYEAWQLHSLWPQFYLLLTHLGKYLIRIDVWSDTNEFSHSLPLSSARLFSVEIVSSIILWPLKSEIQSIHRYYCFIILFHFGIECLAVRRHPATRQNTNVIMCLKPSEANREPNQTQRERNEEKNE